MPLPGILAKLLYAVGGCPRRAAVNSRTWVPAHCPCCHHGGIQRSWMISFKGFWCWTGDPRGCVKYGTNRGAVGPGSPPALCSPHPAPSLPRSGRKCVLHLPRVSSWPLSEPPEVRLLYLCSRSVNLWARWGVSFLCVLGVRMSGAEDRDWFLLWKLKSSAAF